MYPSNFDNSVREFNKLIDDPCAIEQRNNDNNSKLIYITNNYNDLIESKETMNFYGIDIRDQLFVPAEKMDDDSFLRYGKTGGILTNCNIKNEYGALPLPTTPFRGQSHAGDTVTEDSMRNLYEDRKNACIPRDLRYHDRSFYIFDGIEKPDAIKSVETDAFGPRGGFSTRFDC